MGDDPGRETQFQVEGSGRERPQDEVEPGTTPDERHAPDHHGAGDERNPLESVRAATDAQDAGRPLPVDEETGTMTTDASGTDVPALPDDARN